MDNWIDNLRRIGLKRYGDENRRILSELLRNGIPAGNTVMSEASVNLSTVFFTFWDFGEFYDHTAYFIIA